MAGGERTETAAAPLDAATRVPVPHLVVSLNGASPHEAPSVWSLAGIRQVLVGRGAERRAERRQQGSSWNLVVSLADSQVSREHATLERSGATWTFRDAGSRNGSWIDGVRAAPDEIIEVKSGATVQLGRTLCLLCEMPADAQPLGPPHPSLRTVSAALGRRFAELARLLVSAQPAILLRGPTGSGKELVARAIHELYAAKGRRGDFVAVNCGALPDTLVEAELFGAKRGAFSGATEDRLGLIRAADGGTLFLDEIGDLKLSSQAALLRALQEREVVPIGGTRPVPVDVALVCATHRDVEAMRAQGSFREDLYARISGFELNLPPLCQRTEDLGLIVSSLLERSGHDVSFAADAVRALAAHSWPRNVRELAAALAHAAALCDAGVVRAEHLPAPREPFGRATSQDEAVGSAAPGVRSARDTKIRARLVALLEEHRGNIAAVARALGKHRRQVQRWLERFGLDPDDFRPPM
jgi:transcriptional regulator of acetoin/glycerol metabolism